MRSYLRFYSVFIKRFSAFYKNNQHKHYGIPTAKSNRIIVALEQNLKESNQKKL